MRPSSKVLLVDKAVVSFFFVYATTASKGLFHRLYSDATAFSTEPLGTSCGTQSVHGAPLQQARPPGNDGDPGTEPARVESIAGDRGRRREAGPGRRS